MPARRSSYVAALLPRVPVAGLGLVIAASAIQASCTGTVDDEGAEDGGRRDASPLDSSSFDVASQDSPADRADGMSYGNGYGPADAHEDAEHEDSSCVTSTAKYPPAPGCPPGNHTWACWPPPSATAGIPASNYTVVTLCGDVVVIDKNTKLMWGQDGETGTSTWPLAAVACTNSRRAGFSDWRLPSSNELMSLVDYANAKLILNGVFHDNFPKMWSSTPFVQQAGNAWELYASGGVYPAAVSDEANVRCVR
jgi:hypothetical protein